MVINRNNMGGQRFYHSCYKYCLQIFTSFAIPKLSQHDLESKYIDANFAKIKYYWFVRYFLHPYTLVVTSKRNLITKLHTPFGSATKAMVTSVSFRHTLVVMMYSFQYQVLRTVIEQGRKLRSCRKTTREVMQ